MDDVEDLVRTALRDNAAPITQDSLRQPDPPAARRPRTRSAALVAAAFVLAAGGITTAIALRADSGLQWGTQAPAYAGFRWDLRNVDSHEVPADLGASLTFARGGDFRMRDGVNAMFGHYDGTPTSVRLRDVGRTLAAYAGDDPMRRAVIDAMDELSLREAQVSLTQDRLVVITNTHQMTFVRGEPATGRNTPSR